MKQYNIWQDDVFPVLFLFPSLEISLLDFIYPSKQAAIFFLLLLEPLPPKSNSPIPIQLTQ